MKESKSALVKCRVVLVIQFIIGGFIVFVFGLSLVAGLFQKGIGDKLVVCIMSSIFIFFGVLFLRAGIRNTKLINHLNLYKTKIDHQNNAYVGELAAAFHLTPDEVKKDFKIMFHRGFISEVKLFESVRKDVPRQTQNAKGAEFVTVKCQSCGGLNKIQKGKVGECEFCGSPIQA